MTATLEDVDTDKSTTTDPGKHSHYVRREKVTDAIVFGQAVEALCGYVFVPHKNPERMPVCQRCHELHEAMRP